MSTFFSLRFNYDVLLPVSWVFNRISVGWIHRYLERFVEVVGLVDDDAYRGDSYLILDVVRKILFRYAKCNATNEEAGITSNATADNTLA